MNTKCILLSCLLLPTVVVAQLGSSCGSPYIIPLDAVTRTFTASSTTGTAVVCVTGTYPNTSPVTWFSFTTNASAEMPLLDITAADSSSCEVAMYTACNGGSPLQTFSSMCFDDGWGLWSPAHNYNLLPNTTYRLRIKTQTATQIKITGQSYTPTNNNCAGATPVDAASLHDNNACHRPSGEVAPAQLCALTLENTAFYQFYIASPGAAVINISSISCNNGAYNNDNGIQIGFFTGTCGSLVPLNCYAGIGPFVQATTPVLAAGTKVYVAIDGNSGSNCQYDFQAVNAFKVLSLEKFKSFSGWKTNSSNVLKWIGNKDVNSYYQVERSENGSEFYSIGKVLTGIELKEISYQFEDRLPPQHGFYRIKMIAANERVSLSNTIQIVRNDYNRSKLKLINPVGNNLVFEVISNTTDVAEYTVLSIYGQVYFKGTMQLLKGLNKFRKEVSTLPKGQYVLSISSDHQKINAPFIKPD